MVILLLGLVASVALALLSRLVLPPLAAAVQPTMVTTKNLLGEEDSTYLPLSINSRVKFDSSPGAVVYGWPSKGGIYVLFPCFGVELDFLELDRFRNQERPSTSDADSESDEEAHCDRSKSNFFSAARVYLF